MAYGSVLTIEQDAPSQRKERGAFFTPPELANAMSRWAIRDKNDRVLEPSFGEGSFLTAAGSRLTELGASLDGTSQLCGFELHQKSLDAAATKLADAGLSASLACADFMEQKPTRLFDVVIGNPPYVRFQSLESGRRAFYRSLAKTEGIDLSGLASLWAPFVLHAVHFLKKGGRAAFVLPAELLTVNYAAPIRSFLLQSFASITIETFNGRVFPEVQEEVVLLFAEGFGIGASDSILWRHCDSLGDIGENPVNRYSPKSQGARWGEMAVPKTASEVLARLESEGVLDPLASWGTVSLGAVTGANSYFALSAEAIRENGLEKADRLPLCPPGSKHLTVFDVSDDVLRRWTDQGMKTALFYPNGESGHFSKSAQDYIRLGEKLELDKRYKCRKRSPWWRVPLGPIPDAFLTYMNAYGPRLCSNSSGVQNLNSIHGICFNEGCRALAMELLPLACFNSATLLSAEICGRSYGGGVLKIEPGEASKLLVPSLELIETRCEQLRAIAGKAQALLASRSFDQLAHMVDSALFDDRSGIDEFDLESMYQGHVHLRERRQLRAKEA